MVWGMLLNLEEYLQVLTVKGNKYFYSVKRKTGLVDKSILGIKKPPVIEVFRDIYC